MGLTLLLIVNFFPTKRINFNAIKYSRELFLVEFALGKRWHSHYNHYGYQSKLNIGGYAYVYGHKSAAWKYSKELGVCLCESTEKGFHNNSLAV